MSIIPGKTRRGAMGLLAAALASPALSAPAPRRLGLAVAQMTSADGDIDGNLRQATEHAAAARRQGADLVVFPELMPTGYALNETIWTAAEARDGPTVRWLCATSKRLGCAIGTSFLEADGGEYFNTFVLTGQDGRELGRVRKETPASLEAAFFKGEAGPHMIDTPFGRVGVGICYESYLCATARHFAAGRPDLILLPHSFPDMSRTGGLASPPGSFVARWHARRFGVPVAMVNKTGDWRTRVGSREIAGRFPGASAIVAADGGVRRSLDDRPGVGVASVTLDPRRKIAASRCEGELIPELTRFDWLRRS